jgi:Kef-type K+ transport system membrane component KefB
LEGRVSRLAVGVGMVPRGEVGIIFALVGLATMVDGAPLMEPWEYAAVLLVVAITTFVTPIWLKRVLDGKVARAVAPPLATAPEARDEG